MESLAEELLDLMEESGCIGIFLGIESLSVEALVEAGLIAGFDHDDARSVVNMADELQGIGVDVPLLSVLTPFRGTPLFDRLEEDGRLRDVS